MADHDLSAGGDVLDRVTACARAALADYGVRPDADVRLLNVSENATFLVSDADAGPSVLRVHRLGYHSQQAIASELASRMSGRLVVDSEPGETTFTLELPA